MFATEEQAARWLIPLLEGEIRSCFSMTEPAVASSDAANIATTITPDGDEYVVNGRKWWSTGALREECAVAIVMGVSDPDAAKYERHSMILVPLDTPGVRVERSTVSSGTTTARTAGTGSSTTTTSACRGTTSSARRAAGSRWRRPGSAPAGSTTACAAWAWPSVRSS